MKFFETDIRNVWRVALEKREDDRGYFARAWCQQEFEAHGIRADLKQANISASAQKGTLRGMHYQTPPFAEVKLVRCIKGSMFDVAVDLRPESETYRQWVGAELTAENGQMLVIPEGFAHGFVTLEPDTTVSYLVSAFYEPSAESGLRWDDPVINIEWPVLPQEVSSKDKSWPLLD
jgi:dTDP-4-dehydrorhamnose 3,5-epimerase